MRKHTVWILVAVVLMVIGGAAQASAERPRDLIHTYRVWKLTEILDLSDEQMPVFFSKLKQIDEMEVELLEDERKALQEITDLLDDEEIDKAELEKALAGYRDVSRKRREDVDRLRDEAMAGLNLKQRAQYVLFDQRFRSELRSIIEKARDLERQRRIDRRGDMWGDEPGGRDDFGSPGGRGGGRGGSGRGGR